MSNTLIIDSLNTLFSMSNTAVLGAQEQFVAFMNPAAQELFRGDRTNHKLSELLPAHITEATATEFVTSATIEKRHVIISVTSFGAFRLFSLVPQDENALRAGAQFAPFLASLNAFRALTTYFSDYAMQLSDVRFRRNAAELTQFYYRLLRFTLNASTASGLYDGTLAFMPQLCDLGKECRTLLDNIQSITDANGIVLEVIIPDERSTARSTRRSFSGCYSTSLPTARSAANTVIASALRSRRMATTPTSPSAMTVCASRRQSSGRSSSRCA